MQRMITVHLRDEANRDGKKSQDVDGCTAHEEIEVNTGHGVSLRDHGERPLSTCLPSAITLIRLVCHQNRNI